MKCNFKKDGDGVAFKSNFRRREIKFLITEAEAKEVLEFMANRIVPDSYGKSTVKSLYFDTPTFRLIRRSLEKPIYKEKFRLRCYGDFNDKTKVFAEIKKKYKSVVYKRRIVLNEAEMLSFLENGPQNGNDPIEKEIDFFFKRYENLKPAMLVSCEREAYFAKGDDGLRFTFDRNIIYRDYDLSLRSERYGTPVMNEGQVLMEIKAEAALPLWVCKMLSKRKMYKQSFSKYGRAYMDTLLKAKTAVQTAKGE